MSKLTSRFVLLASAVLIVSCARSETDAIPPGGTSATGGAAGTPAPTGGTSATGGASAAGGRSSGSGASSTGGASGPAGASGTGGAPDGAGGAPPPSNPGAPGCALPAAAFCDPLATPSPGGRGGDVDDAKWSVTRISNGFNPGQGQWITYPLGHGLICGKSVSDIVPPDDYTICTDSNGPHLTQTADDGGGNIVSSFRPRQAFDFAGRTGVITFDLGGRQAGGHGFWPEIIITSEPSPAPYQDLIGIFPFPREAIGVELANQPSCEYRTGSTYTSNGVSAIKVIRNYLVSGWGPNDLHADYDGTGKPSEPPCFPVNDTRMNHYELRLSASTVELWVTDPGADPGTLRLVAKKEGINLGFTRGYVSFQQAHYNAGKDDHLNIPPTHTFNWANVGFDGPVLPIERGYDVPDALAPYRDLGTTIGYRISASAPLAFPLAGMDLSGATAAALHLNVYGFYAGRILQFRFNGGAWQSFVSDLPANMEQRSLHIPVPMTLLRTGDNLLEIKAGGPDDMAGANFDVTVR